MQSTRYSCHCLKKGFFSRKIFEKQPKISNFMKIRRMGAEFFPVEEQTDELARSRFSQFCERARQHLKRRVPTT